MLGIFLVSCTTSRTTIISTAELSTTPLGPEPVYLRSTDAKGIILVQLLNPLADSAGISGEAYRPDDVTTSLVLGRRDATWQRQMEGSTIIHLATGWRPSGAVGDRISVPYAYVLNVERVSRKGEHEAPPSFVRSWVLPLA